MKYFSAALLLCVIGFTTQAQSHFDNGGYLKVGLIFPASDFGDLSEYDASLREKFLTGQGDFDETPARVFYDEARLGYSLEFGHIWFLGAIPTPEFMKLGIDVAFMELNYNNVRHQLRSVAFGQTQDELTMHHAYIGPKAGILASFSPNVEGLALDLSFKAQFLVSGAFGTYDYNVNVGGQNLNFQDGIAAWGVGVRYNPGIAIRYRLVMAGFEWNIGELNHRATSVAAGGEAFDNRMSLSNTKVTLGIKF